MRLVCRHRNREHGVVSQLHHAVHESANGELITRKTSWFFKLFLNRPLHPHGPPLSLKLSESKTLVLK